MARLRPEGIPVVHPQSDSEVHRRHRVARSLQLAVFSLLVFHPSVVPAGTDPARKCAAAKIKASGKRFAAVSKCHAKAVLTRTAVAPDCLDRAEDKFTLAFAKAESGGACALTGDAAATDHLLDVCTDTVVVDLARRCGDGIVAPSEPCDDGNATDGDGCSATCTVETGFECTGAPSACTSSCGDGVVASNELCDDGGQADGDGCSASCTIETGFTCAGAPSACSGICGDGLVRGAETCDDGGTSGGDGCSSACAREGGWNCSGEPTVCTCGVSAVLYPAGGLKIPQALTLDASSSYSGCGLPLQYFWNCFSEANSEFPDFNVAANSNGNTNAVVTWNLIEFDITSIRLTVCIAGTSICAPEILQYYEGAPVDL